jgi:LuxR family transcriptional regulator, maltose regulon positive regulatory protein
MNSSTSNQLLHMKLKPPRLHEGMIQRNDLLARLDGGLAKKLTVVNSPAGFGKTTLVNSWIVSHKVNAAWYTTDEHDNDPARFWTYFITALRTFDATIGRSTLSMLMTSQPSIHRTLLTPLINDLTHLDENSVLVLDDYHLITSQEINAGISFLLHHLPDTLHLLLTTRTEPDLPLSLLRARNELLEIETSSLRFTRVETEVFLQREAGSRPHPSLVDFLFQKTEGWAAGLQLILSSPQNKFDLSHAEHVRQLSSGNNQYVSDFLITEVFATRPEATQTFLLKTCFFQRLSPSLCDAITETSNSVRILQQLESDNLFITQFEHASGQPWYRYHPLFVEAVQQIARIRLNEEEITQLFVRAGDWYEHQGLYNEAAEAFISAGSITRALATMERLLEIHDISEMRTISRWLEHIPDRDILLHPAICFAYAQIILYTTDRFAYRTIIQIEPFLQAAESAWRTEGHRQRLGELLSFRGIAAWWQDDSKKAFDYVREALAELPESSVFWRGNSLLILSHEIMNEGRILDAQGIILEALALLGAAQNIFGVLAANQVRADLFYWRGVLEQAEQLCKQILSEAVGDDSMLDDQGIAYLGLARILYERNELDQSEHFARRALDLAEQRANEMLQVQATMQLALVQSAKGDMVAANETLNSLESRLKHPSRLREIQNCRALFTIQAGDPSGLGWWTQMASSESESQQISRLQKEQEAFILARMEIATGKTREALTSIYKWKIDAERNGRIRRQIEALCLEALAYHAASNFPQAASLLIEALTLGQAHGFHRVFLDEGLSIARLLQDVLPLLPSRTLKLFATILLRSLSSEITANLTETQAAVQIEALSPQELRVLRLLSAGLSNSEIARELVVSTNTIKTQVKSIYRKLNVRSREEAGAVARELRLV